MEKYLCCIIVILCLVSVISAANRKKEIFDGLMKNYDKDVIPKTEEGDAPTVYFLFYFTSIDISTKRMILKAEFYLRSYWYDHTLKFTDPLVKQLRLTSEQRGKLWKPDAYFRDGVKVERFTEPIDNTLMFLYNDGKVYMAERFSVEFHCIMRLQKFPYDTQACRFTLEDFSHQKSEVKYDWNPKNRISLDEAKDAVRGYQIIETATYDCSQNYTNGEYNCLGITLGFKREVEYYARNLLIPGAFILIIAYLGLWVPFTAMGVRLTYIAVMILLLCLITLTNANWLYSDPDIPYLRAIDFFLPVCFLIVVQVLIESVLVAILAPPATEEQKSMPRGLRILEMFSKVWYPIGVFIFFIIYFSAYLS